MKNILDYRQQDVVDVFDEVTLWSAPFGRLLLEHIPMIGIKTIVDIGFGTGFPLIELSQRFGDDAELFGIDVWPEAIQHVKRRIQVLEITNVTILEESAATIAIGDEVVDLVTSNLGVNNFEDKASVYREIHRVLRTTGHLCITTNPIGTFKELFNVFETVLTDLGLDDEKTRLADYVSQRSTKEDLTTEISKHGFVLSRSISDTAIMRFADAAAVFDHSLIRIGFRSSWEELVPKHSQDAFFSECRRRIAEHIATMGEFAMTIPILYLQFDKI